MVASIQQIENVKYFAHCVVLYTLWCRALN